MEPMTAQMPDATLGLLLCVELVLFVAFFIYVKTAKS